MWYFAWILGTLLACCFGIVTALALEQSEVGAMDKNATKNDSADGSQ